VEKKLLREIRKEGLAEQFLGALRERFAKFSLELHAGKTRLLEFAPRARSGASGVRLLLPQRRAFLVGDAAPRGRGLDQEPPTENTG
jgi:hypothetical protein